MAGFFIIEDPAEAALGLPSGSHDVPLVFTDKRVNASRQLVYAASMMDVMSGMVHTSNGQPFDMLRMDLSIPFGDLEMWEYRNTGTEPHPMRAHAAPCQLLSRSSPASLPPEDGGWKDAVLVNPGETVLVLTPFDTHSGVLVHHCHDLEHEYSGMMQNFIVLPPPTLTVQRDGTNVTLSWPEGEQGWRSESSAATIGASWDVVAANPTSVGGRRTVAVSEVTGRRFYRLVTS